MSFDLTPWMTGKPVRPGLYVASAERNDSLRAYWDGAQWSRQVDEAASDAEHDSARMSPMSDRLQHVVEWRGLTRASAAWFAADLVREPTTKHA